MGSFKYTRDVIAQLQADTHVLIASHGGNVAIAEIVEYLAAKVFADGAAQLPRRPGTPSRSQAASGGGFPAPSSSLSSSLAVGGGTSTLSDPVPEGISGHMLLTLSSEYCEDDLHQDK
jgi:hypothetical protein